MKNNDADFLENYAILYQKKRIVQENFGGYIEMKNFHSHKNFL